MKVNFFLLTSLTDSHETESTVVACLASDIFTNWLSIDIAFRLRENAHMTFIIVPSPRTLLAWSYGIICPRHRIFQSYFLIYLTDNVIVHGILIKEVFKARSALCSATFYRWAIYWCLAAMTSSDSRCLGWITCLAAPFNHFLEANFASYTSKCSSNGPWADRTGYGNSISLIASWMSTSELALLFLIKSLQTNRK